MEAKPAALGLNFHGPSVLVGFNPWLWAVQIYEEVVRRKKAAREGAGGFQEVTWREVEQ